MSCLCLVLILLHLRECRLNFSSAECLYCFDLSIVLFKRNCGTLVTWMAFGRDESVVVVVVVVVVVMVVVVVVVMVVVVVVA